MMRTKNHKSFVAVKTRYYKREAAFAVLDHSYARRNGFTRSSNVHPEFSHNNRSRLPKGCKSAVDSLEMHIAQHKEITGKKPRTDFNMLFEHVVVFSEAQYSLLEQEFGEREAKNKLMEHLNRYAIAIKKEFGFSIMAIQLHQDEGRYEYEIDDSCASAAKWQSSFHDSEKKTFVRNVHAHVSFYNYDMKNKIAPLRHLMKKGCDAKGRTCSSNPHFERMQDIAGEVFSPLGFERGVPKDVTGNEHLSREEFIKRKLETTRNDVVREEQTKDALRSENEVARKNRDELSEQVNILEKKRQSLVYTIDALKNYMNKIEQAIKHRCYSELHVIRRRVGDFLKVKKKR